VNFGSTNSHVPEENFIGLYNHKHSDYSKFLSCFVFVHYPVVPSLACFAFNLFSCFMNSKIPTGIPLKRSVSSPVPQFVSLPPPSSSMLTIVCCAPFWPSPSIKPVPVFFLRSRPFPRLFSFSRFASAAFRAAAHSCNSSPYRSHTQFTHPLIQQLSGSSGRGGTHTPAIRVLLFSISARRSAGPASRDPNTTRAFAKVSSLSVLGRDVGGDGVVGCRVADVRDGRG
jgi:hypothetical protein